MKMVKPFDDGQALPRPFLMKPHQAQPSPAKLVSMEVKESMVNFTEICGGSSLVPTDLNCKKSNKIFKMPLAPPSTAQGAPNKYPRAVL